MPLQEAEHAILCLPNTAIVSDRTQRTACKELETTALENAVFGAKRLHHL